MRININGTWKTISRGVININGAWKTISRAVININGVWKSLLFGGPSITQQVEIEQTTDIYYIITLVGYNYYWSDYSSSAYKFQKSTNGGSTWTNIDAGTVLNPPSGSSNTTQYVLQSLTPNVANLYRFSVTTTSSSGETTTSTSTSTTVQAPRNITNLSATSVNGTSITLGWTASQYSGSQRLEYREVGTSTWNTYNTYSGSTNSATVSSVLNANTQYAFRIIPFTGTSGQGYSGNPSNTATEYTSASLPGPISITLEPYGINGLQASWSATDATTYYIDVYQTSNGSSITDNNGNQYPRTNTSSTSALFTGLPYSTSYRAYGYGKNVIGSGDPAYSSIVTTGSDPHPGSFTYYINATTTVPGHASNLNLYQSSTNNFTLTWSAGSNASNYTVYLSGIVSATVNTTSTSLSRSFTSTGWQYATVEAYNNNTKATISWTSSSGAQSYFYSYTLGGTSYTGVINGTSFDVYTSGQSITINYVFAYSGLNATGYATAGSSGGTNTITPTVAYPSFGSNPSTQTYFYYTSPGVAPGVPGTPTLNYLSANTNSYNYSATFFSSTTGTEPINYYLRCYGVNDNYTSQLTTKGPFTGIPGGNVSTGTFTLPKTDVLWKVAAYAQNTYGTSNTSAKSNSA